MRSKYIFIICVIIVLLTNISYIQLIINSTYLGWLTNITYLIGIVSLTPKIYFRVEKIEWIYISIMLLGYIFHCTDPTIQNPLNDSIKWVFLVFLIVAGRIYRLPRQSFIILVVFFIIHWGLAVIEYIKQIHIFDYSYTENFEAFVSNTNFRAFGLMEHPLYSANITLIVLSFVVINQNINKYLKIGVIIFGSYALICFNSRAAILIWGVLLVYRLFLYNCKPILIIILGLFICILFINYQSNFIQQNLNIFGRLAEKKSLADDSSMTRISSYSLFWNQRWNFQDILIGGRIIYYPGTKTSLENGILLTISWWGWIVGVLKCVLEIIISYNCLEKYSIKDRIFVLISCWGCAFTNNNTINTFVFAFFIITFLVVNSMQYRKVAFRTTINLKT